MAVQVTTLARSAAGDFWWLFTNFTIEITVVIGVMKRNQRRKISAIFSGNQ
jgi:hypothetical protein